MAAAGEGALAAPLLGDRHGELIGSIVKRTVAATVAP